MKIQKLHLLLAILLIVQLFFLSWISSNYQWVEYYYSQGLYPFTSFIFRVLFNTLHFSFGDVLYAIVAVYLIYKLFIIVKNKALFKLATWIQLAAFLSIVLFLFNVLWGFNYYRKPLVNQLAIQKTSFTISELEFYANQLIIDINKIHQKITQNDSLKVNIPYSQDSIYQLSIDGYLKLNSTYPFLKTPYLKVKNSLFSTPLSYMGFAGYLNPFTNEAQVNKHIPLVSLITTSGHELAHQIGYGAEFEAHMLSYLMTTNHDDVYFQYAGKLLALRYTLHELYWVDEQLYQKYFDKVNYGIKLNINESQAFWEQYHNPLEPLFKTFYDVFLKSNAQKEGIKSYKKVLGLLVNYRQNKN